MLRLVVIVLLLANAGYYAWSQGLLRQWNLAPQEQAEPQRMSQQLHPETLQILKVSPGPSAPAVAPASAPATATKPADPSAPSAATTGAPPAAPEVPPVAATSPASTATAASSRPGQCLQAGLFDERQADALRLAAANLPQGSWVLEPTPLPGRWMVYMGRFEDAEALDKKRTELRARKVDFDRAGGTLEPGLSLGRFSTEEAARRELGTLTNKGVRTARVVQERPDSTGFTLRLPAVNDGLRPQLDALRTALGGKPLRACTPP